MSENTEQVMVRVSKALKERLQEEARGNDRSVGGEVRNMVEEALRERETQRRRILRGYSVMRQADGFVMSD